MAYLLFLQIMTHDVKLKVRPLAPYKLRKINAEQLPHQYK